MPRIAAEQSASSFDKIFRGSIRATAAGQGTRASHRRPFHLAVSPANGGGTSRRGGVRALVPSASLLRFREMCFSH
jgi:hypothetical protein